jgi:hypothetical protein
MKAMKGVNEDPPSHWFRDKSFKRQIPMDLFILLNNWILKKILNEG